MSVPATSEAREPGLRRSLSVWQAVGLSVALMAPSMAANINPQGTAGLTGRAVPLAFFLAAIGVLLVAYGFVRLCQYYQHAGSVYAFVGATLGPRSGFVSGFGLLGTYSFYGVVTASATGIFGTAFLQETGIWHAPPTWAPFLLAAVALACMVGASRLLFALGRDVFGDKGIGQTSGAGTPANAAVVVALLMALIIVVSAVFFDAEAFDTFLWSGTIGTLILLVIYVLTTIGAARLVFIQKKMAVPMWQVVIPIAALLVLGYTIYRNVIPYPTEGPAQWFPIVAGAWLLLAIIVVLASPGLARGIGANLTASEGLQAGVDGSRTTSPRRSDDGVRG